MALTVTNKGSAGSTTGTTTYALSPGTSFTAGVNEMGVLVIALDNGGSGGATAAAPASFTDAKGNTWTQRHDAIYDPGAASAGIELAFYTAPMTTALLSTDSSTISWAAGVTVASKASAWYQISGSIGPPRYFVNGNNAGAASAAPTMNIGALAIGEVLIGGGASESANTWADAANATGGAWAARQSSAGGTGTSGAAVTAQSKVITAIATHVFNPTLTSADVIIGYIGIVEQNPYHDMIIGNGWYG